MSAPYQHFGSVSKHENGRGAYIHPSMRAFAANSPSSSPSGSGDKVPFFESMKNARGPEEPKKEAPVPLHTPQGLVTHGAWLHLFLVQNCSFHSGCTNNK